MDNKPEWLKKKYVEHPNRKAVENILQKLRLNTVCNEAACPNYVECYANCTATFMLLGTNCTRNCRFCNVNHHQPQEIDLQEPENIAKAVAELHLSYVVITSVTRDDLEDGGASHFASVIQAIKKQNPTTKVEVLIPDFQGNESALNTVIGSEPTVIGHNMETVSSLYQDIRPQADYRRSLNVLANIKKGNANIYSKTGIMLGLGETKKEVLQLLDDLQSVGCDFLTIGQYLPPSPQHYPAKSYIHPDIFSEYKKIAELKKFSFVASAPFVRSSYRAWEALI